MFAMPNGAKPAGISGSLKLPSSVAGLKFLVVDLDSAGGEIGREQEVAVLVGAEG
jgi:hypothetical protein